MALIAQIDTIASRQARVEIVFILYGLGMLRNKLRIDRRVDPGIGHVIQRNGNDVKTKRKSERNDWRSSQEEIGY